MLDRPAPDRSAFLDALARVVGQRHLLTAEADTAPHLVEWRGLYRGRALAVAKPGTTAEVAGLVRLAREAGVPLVPQGGNTGLVGGQIPDEGGSQLVVSLARLSRVREVDPASDAMVCEAGVTLARAQEAAAEAGRLFPLSLASEGSATIGGVLSTNAGGTAVLAYGTARDLALGLEVVLPDGRVWEGLSKLRKDNTGYDLKHLFMGAEGTLGVITAATLRLFPRPAGLATAFAGLPSVEAALELLTLAKARGGPALTTFEFLPRLGLELVLRHAEGTRDPLGEPHPWYVLIELSSSVARDGEHGPDALLEAILGEAAEAGHVADAVLAASDAQRAALWRLREMLSEVQGAEGGSIKHDVSVPVASVPGFVAEASAAVEALVPGCRPLPFGHLGDGNVHFNVSQPPGADKAGFLARWRAMNAAVHALARARGGSISAEHGIGRLKRELLPEARGEVAMDVMRAIKVALDPAGLFNPGKLL